jgi:hypothetical protein
MRHTPRALRDGGNAIEATIAWRPRSGLSIRT